MEEGNYKLSKIKFHGKKVYLSIQGDFVLEDYCTMAYRDPLKKETKQFDFATSKNTGNRMTVVMDFDQVPLKPLYYDFWVVKKDGKKIPIKAGRLAKLLHNPFYQDGFRQGDMILYPYIHQGIISFCYRKEQEWDKTSFRLKELLALFLYQFQKKKLEKQKSILFYEKYCYGAQDNAYYAFLYAMEHPEVMEGKTIYYVIDPKSPDYKAVKRYRSHVIPFMSLKHMLSLLSCKLLVSTDTKAHAYCYRKRHSYLQGRFKKKPLVFLQHGVISLKDVRVAYAKEPNHPCDLFIVSTRPEKEIIERDYGYLPEEVALTGLARWDAIEDKSKGRNQILFMPTWRNYLDEISREEFVKSKYYKSLVGVLQDETLGNVLRNHEANLVFYVHSKFRQYMDLFADHMNNENLDVISVSAFEKKPLNELLMESSMLMTDYSSTSYDMFYMGKPVVFYQFDREDYQKAHGSHIDLKKDLFGPSGEKKEEIPGILAEILDRNFVLSDKEKREREKLFPKVDRENSKRIWQAMEERIFKTWN